MVISNIAETILRKCEIYYEDALISKERIIEKYIKFFSDALTNEKRSVSFALHTGSVCFDLASVVAVTLGCLSYNTSTNDDIIATLEFGDMVMYKNQRYHWHGIHYDETNKKDYIELEQDAKGKNGPLKKYISLENKYLVKPYYGTSKFTDGRGVKHSKTNREEFLSYMFDIPIENVPSVIEIAVVIVANRNSFNEICKNIKIVYGDKKQIGILDIVPAAYYTSGGEKCQYGKNPTKVDPVLKVTGKIATARELVLNKHGNKTIGLFVTGIDSLTDNGSELADLLRRKTLQFVYISTPIKAEIGEHILAMYEDARVFACTKDYLLKNAGEINERNSFTIELEQQISNIVDNIVCTIPVSGGWSWDEYRQIKSDLFLISRSNWNDEFKNHFILSAYALLNLLTSSFFTMSQMENAVAKGRFNATVMSPGDSISEIRDIASNAGMMKEKCLLVVDALERKYNELKCISPKGLALQEYLECYVGKRIAVIVPKAYYADMLPIVMQTDVTNNNITCVTANCFDTNIEYDAILVVGDIRGKRFDPLQCRSVKKVDIMLYDCERKLFVQRKKKQDKFEQKLNARVCGFKYEEIPAPIVEEINFDDADEDSVQVFSNLEQYIESINIFDIRKLVTGEAISNSNALVSEVKYVGTFITGEQILFSKYYSAVVFDRKAGKVAEKMIDKLAPGDHLVFNKRDDYTQNIVDFVFEKLLSTGRLSKSTVDASEKAFYWKEVLREYKENGDYTYRFVAEQLREVGSSIQEVTVREWLIKGSHIVGPRNVKTMECIAKVTQDPYLLADVNGYFEACRIVRRERRRIFRLIATAINDKLSGHTPQEGSVLEIVYKNVNNLSEILELSSISELNENISINNNLVNRPITEAEVSI